MRVIASRAFDGAAAKLLTSAERAEAEAEIVEAPDA
jgi:hypothetical protein